MSSGQLGFEEQVYQKNDAQQVSTSNVNMADYLNRKGREGHKGGIRFCVKWFDSSER